MQNSDKYLQKDKNKTDLYPQDIFEKLEFNKIRDLLSEHCLGELGRARVAQMSLMTEPALIQKHLQQTHQFKQLLMYEEQAFPSENYIDLRTELALLGIQGSALSEEQCVRLMRVLRTMTEVLRYFGDRSGEKRRELYPEIFELVDSTSVSRNLLVLLKNVFDDSGKVRSDASRELQRLRKAIGETYRDLDRKFNALIGEYRRAGWLSDTEESMRNGRRVLAINAEHKRKLRGILHDVSGTGGTVFIEPEETMHLNNELVELQQAEKHEIYRILRELTDAIRPFKTEMEQHRKLLGVLDFIRAKARIATEINAFMPHLSDDKSIELFSARHPLLFLKNKAQNKTVVPLNLSLSIANRILLVSGPNAGGKSVMLKTIGLLQLMLQSGMLVPVADHSTMSIFKNIFVDIGDEQSIENDLSTYSSRLKNLRYFTEFANAKTLILIDEFGSGTDPMVGGAIAEAALEFLNKKFCYGIITTHYANLKIFATQTKGIINGCMLFDMSNLSPLYKLDTGKPGSSFAFELAQKSGLNTDLIASARKKIDTDYAAFDELLTSLQREKQDIEARERSAVQKEEQYKKLLGEYKEKVAELDKKRKEILLETKQKALGELHETNRKFDTLLREWSENKGEKALVKQIKAEIEQDKQHLTQTVETLKDGIYYRDSQQTVQAGVYVRLRDGREIGQVAELRKDQAVVTFDLLRSTIKIRDLVVVEPVKNKEHKESTSFVTLSARSEFESTIDIRGQRREEALSNVENFVDKALLFGVDDIKIIHGVGDGILRRSVRDLLRKYKAVRAVSDEEQQYGGAGVSLVTLGT